MLFFPRVEYWELFSSQCLHICLILLDNEIQVSLHWHWHGHGVVWCLCLLLLQVILSSRWDALWWLLLHDRNHIMFFCIGLWSYQCPKLETRRFTTFSIFYQCAWCQLSHLYVQLAKKKEIFYMYILYILHCIMSILVSSWMHCLFISFHPF